MPSGFEGRFRVLRMWMEEDLVGDPVFGGMSPSELVEWQINARGREAMRLRVRLQLWINGHKKWRYKTKRKYFSNVSSFFLHNFAAFPPDPSFSFSSDVAPVRGRLVFEACRQIIFNCDPKYKTVFVMFAQAFLGISEFRYINENLAAEVVRHVTRNDGIFRLDLPGRKRGKNREPFSTFLCSDSDFGDCFLRYMREARHDVTKVLFVNNNGEPLTKANIEHYFNARAVEVGIINPITPVCGVCGGETVKFRAGCGRDVPVEHRRKTGYRCKSGHVTWSDLECVDFLKGNRYGVNPHEIRDLMRTRWESSGANGKVVEFMMGHMEKVDPNSYLSWSKYERHVPMAEYRKALPYLNILSEDPRKVDRVDVEAQLEASRAETRATSEKLIKLERELAEIRAIIRDRTD